MEKYEGSFAERKKQFGERLARMKYEAQKAQKQQAIQWFIQFANMDLDGLGPGDKAKLLIESEEIFFPRTGGPTLVPPMPPKDSTEYWARLLKLQERIREHLEKILKPNEKIILQVKKALFGLEWKGTFELYITPFIGSFEDIDIRFFRLLENLPASSIQKCMECKKYFFNPTKRKKKFCSSKCLWRVSSRKRREADPEGYREKQAKLMKKRYKEMKRAKLGAKVKVGREV